MNRYIITTEQLKGQEYLISALYDETNKMIEVFPEPLAKSSMLGNIYVGRVDRIVKNLNAAFITISPGQNCYFSLEDFKNPIFTQKRSERQALAQGDELLVQVSKEALKTKDPVVTCNLTFTGTYAVLTTGKLQLSVSSKLSAGKREHYIHLLEQHLPEADQRRYGVIVRTNAQTISDEELLLEISFLSEQLEQLLETAGHKTCFTCVHTEPAIWEKNLKGLRQDQSTEIITDEYSIYQKICCSYGISKEQLVTGGRIKTQVTACKVSDAFSIRYYEDKALSLSALYSVKTNLDRAVQERVWLKSGAYLIIQPTEALTVIDVNTGKNVSPKEVQENFRKVNREAAYEIARQLRLRNISGIIVVDFINLISREAEEELLAEFRKELKCDPVPTQLIDMTKLGLVEITRKKVRKSLAEMLA